MSKPSRPRFQCSACALLAAMLLAVPALAQPPLHISAANMTGSRGPEGDIVLLNGDVRIERGRTLITADNGRYHKAQGMLFLDGRVTLVDTTTTLRCDHAQYSEDQDLLEVSGNVVITDRGATLRAPRGSYDRRRGRADLYDGVHAQDSTQTITCETLSYDRDSLRVHARGNVQGEAKRDKMILRAKSVDYDRGTHEAWATGDPVLETRDDRDRLGTIRALRMKLNTQTRLAEAIDSVRIQRDTLQATGRYGVFDDAAERGWLYGEPRAWDNETQVSGDTLEVWTEKRALRRFIVRGSASMDYKGDRPNTRGEASRLKGERIQVFFTRDEMDSLQAMGEASNEYQAVPREGKTPESNVAQGDTITVYFRNRKIDRAVVWGKARGEYHFPVDVADTTAARMEVVRYDAKQIEFQVPRNRIVLDQEAQLYYREIQLQSKKVEFDSERQTLVASGTPELIDRGDKVTGDLMTYDLESRQGTIYQAETTYERGLYHGEAIRKVSEDELDVQAGSFSTCSLEAPHYHFQAQWMKIFLKDKMIAKPVVFYVRNVPLLALPFWMFPIKPGRHSGFLFPQIEFGFSNAAGQFIRNAGYYWAPNDYMDLTVAGDYYQAEPSWVLRGEGNYRLLYVLDGAFYGTYTRSELSQTASYEINAVHNQEVTPRTHLTSLASFVSSRDYRRSNQYGQPLSRRVDRFLTSNLALTHNADWASVSMALDRREDLDADEEIKDPDGEGPLQGKPPGTVAALSNLVEAMPRLAIAFPTRSMGSIQWVKDRGMAPWVSNLYTQLNTEFHYQRERTGFVEGYRTFQVDSTTIDSTTVIGQRQNNRWGWANFVSLRDARRAFGWINVAPNVAANLVLFDHDNLGNEVVPAATWRAGFTTSATFYGASRLRIGPIVGLRHIVVPIISYDYSPEFDNLLYTDSLGIHDRFTGFGNIGLFSGGSKSSRLQLQLDQRWQAKVRKGDKVQRIDNLLSWNISGTYNFLYREQGQEHPLSVLNSRMLLSPPGFVGLDVSGIVDVYNDRPLRSLSSSLGIHLAGTRGTISTDAGSTPELPLERRSAFSNPYEINEPWSLGLAFSYAGGYSAGPNWTNSQTVANGVARYNLTPSWRMEYSASVDVVRAEMLTQRFGLIRDLHCWQASFTRIFNVGGEAEYYFRLGVKDQREVFVERGTRIGSIGGIQ